MRERALPDWEHFPHEADMGVRGYGATRNQAFEQAGLALMQVILDPERVEERESIEFQCEAPDDELLLVDWLNALIYAMATRHLLFRRFEVRGEGHGIQARAWGEAIDPARHRPAVEVKGATYTELYVGREADGRWRAQCVVDV
ncbi:MAG: archease [Gammaproteobacteria bacterium]|nr:archease [Gammaproteobacteria bacterium]